MQGRVLLGLLGGLSTLHHREIRSRCTHAPSKRILSSYRATSSRRPATAHHSRLSRWAFSETIHVRRSRELVLGGCRRLKQTAITGLLMRHGVDTPTPLAKQMTWAWNCVRDAVSLAAKFYRARAFDLGAMKSPQGAFLGFAPPLDAD